MTIRKAERKRAKVRIGICGTSGSGKTHSSLRLAKGMGGTIVVIDTEHNSAELETGKPNIPEYFVIGIEAPFTIQKYIAALHEAEKGDLQNGVPPADVIIIDSLTHQWEGSGGLLDKKEAIVRSGKENSYTAYRSITPEHSDLIEAMLQSPSHIIATMRSKTDYVLETNDKGKQVPRKVGLAPIIRPETDYEFTIVLDLDNVTHYASVRGGKDRTGIFDGQPPLLLTDEIGLKLRLWFESGAAETALPTTHPQTNGTVAGVKQEQRDRLKSILDKGNIHGETRLSIEQRANAITSYDEFEASIAKTLEWVKSKGGPQGMEAPADGNGFVTKDQYIAVIEERLTVLYTDVNGRQAQEFIHAQSGEAFFTLDQVKELADLPTVKALWEKVKRYGGQAEAANGGKFFNPQFNGTQIEVITDGLPAQPASVPVDTGNGIRTEPGPTEKDLPF